MNKLNNIKKALVVVDMLKGFRTEGAMHIEGLEKLDIEVLRLVKLFLQNEYDVISLQENHTNNSVEFNYFPVHCLKDSKESELIDVLLPFKDKMKVIYKNSTSGFVTNDFQNYLKSNKDLNEIVFVGLCEDICVANAAIPTKMFFNENNVTCDVIVPLNATDTYDSLDHPKEEYKSLARKMFNLNGIKTIERYGDK